MKAGVALDSLSIRKGNMNGQHEQLFRKIIPFSVKLQPQL